MSAAILCPAVWISDVVNKASMCGKGIENVMIQPFYALHWYIDMEQMNMAVPWGAQIWSKKEYFLAWLLMLFALVNSIFVDTSFDDGDNV